MSKTVIIDAGHGGTDPGAKGFGVNEKDWTLSISLYQYRRLKECGVDVALTRQSDVSLNPTQRIARIRNQYDLCVSNHWNAFNSQARGVETIHSIHAKADFARALAEKLAHTTGLPLRRVFTREIRKGVDYYYMHRLTGNTETVIVEYGFIDNQIDHQYYLDQAKFISAAEAVVECICIKVGVSYQPPIKKTALHTSEQPANVITESLERFKGFRLESIHNGELRFYNKPSWSDDDVFGFMKKGQTFTEILDKLKVGSGEQYKVRNARGQVFYVTASPKFVRIV